MLHLRRTFSMFAAIIVLLAVLTGPIAAEFGYGDVYWLDEENDAWVKDDGSKATWRQMESGDSYTGNAGGSMSITGRVIVEDFQPTALSTFGTLNSPTDFYEYVSPNGIFSIKVRALPFDDETKTDMIWDPVEKRFFLAHERTVARWEFTYKVTNNLGVGMDVLLVQDNFGAELVIEKTEIQTPLGEASKNVLILGQPGPYGFQWKTIRLEPGESAQITFTLVAGKNPAGKQHYECGLYDLNSLGVLKYRYDGQPGQGQKSVDGMTFPLKVCDKEPDPICVSFELSNTGVEWYLRKPGDFYTKLLDGAVKVTGGGSTGVKVGVTFSEFGNLISATGQEVPVYYSLPEQASPETWLTPEHLNDENFKLELEASAESDAAFGIWQRVVLDVQSPGVYQNVGVITFTLVNSQPIVFD